MPRGIKRSEEEVKLLSQRAIKLYEQGLTMQEVSEVLKCPRESLKDIFKNSGYHTRPRAYWDQTGEKNHTAILNWAKVKEIRHKYQTKKVTHAQLAEEYGVGKSCITKILTGKNWKSES